jgi:chorismate mutase / prephenate dehydrogenase
MPPPDPTRLGDLRQRLAELDASILDLVASRQSIAKEIGRIKAGSGRSTRDYSQEREVTLRARAAAEKVGLDPNVAEEIALLLIRASLTAQEQDRVQMSGEGKGRRVLIIGGAGKMGGWLARFLGSQGFSIEIADPAAQPGAFPHIADWRTSSLDHDIIIVAAPLRASGVILRELAERRPSGVVFDVGSLKTPLRPGIEALLRAGVAVTSVHPMFGPDTELLSGRHVIFIDVGHAAATKVARELFGSTMVVQVEMDLDSHDRLISYILGLSHAVNITFLAALAGSGEDADRLRSLSSTTFDAQLDVARRVSLENPHLYFEIQSLNEHGSSVLDKLLSVVERFRASVLEGDEAAFVEMMARGREYLDGTSP